MFLKYLKKCSFSIKNELLSFFLLSLLAVCCITVFINCASYEDACEQSEDECFDKGWGFEPGNCQPGSSLFGIIDCVCDCYVPEVCQSIVDDCYDIGGEYSACKCYDGNDEEVNCKDAGSVRCECDCTDTN